MSSVTLDFEETPNGVRLLMHLSDGTGSLVWMGHGRDAREAVTRLAADLANTPCDELRDDPLPLERKQWATPLERIQNLEGVTI